VKLLALLRDVWRSGPGRAGLILLAVLLAGALAVVLTYPTKFGTERWANPALWADNPRSAPPAWTNLLTRDRRVRHRVFHAYEPTAVTESARARELVFDFPFTHDADEAPPLLTVSLSSVGFEARPPQLSARLVRPDGSIITLFREAVGGGRGEGPFMRHEDEPLRVVVGDDRRLLTDLADTFEELYGGAGVDEIASAPLSALFSAPGEEGLEPLQGAYTLQAVVLAAGESDAVGEVTAVVGGSVYGVMGTDALGRDLAAGILYGLPVALLIGILTATVSTLLGMTLGMVSGYFGGVTDLVVQRSADIVANVPLLPLLIFLVFIVGSKLWLILAILVAFSWPGLTIMVRTMVLQLRDGQEVDAARALGASSGRIIFAHILPHAASYLLAQLVFFAPSAILAEAGLSFLGLGDPSIPTWGQILEYGFRTGAVFLGYWWWVIPPGLMIIITSMTFMFLALGLEPVVDPRLRGRRVWRS
jgi:peptide/nickel transport system permease protein